MKALEWWQSFSNSSHCDLDHDPIMLLCKLVQHIVIPSTCVKLYRNWRINEISRVMTKCEHTYEQDPISPSLCKGIIRPHRIKEDENQCFIPVAWYYLLHINCFGLHRCFLTQSKKPHKKRTYQLIYINKHMKKLSYFCGKTFFAQPGQWL